MRALLVVLLVLGLALVAFGVLGLLGVWGGELPTEPEAETVVVAPPAPGASGPVPLGGGTVTVTQIYEDGGSIAFVPLALLGVVLAFIAWYGLRRARPRA